MKREPTRLGLAKWVATMIFVVAIVLLWATGWVRVQDSAAPAFWSLEAVLHPPNPFWIPVLVFGAATALLWYMDRRRVPSGHCRKCGYDLTGNVSGRCPECGTPFGRGDKTS